MEKSKIFNGKEDGRKGMAQVLMRKEKKQRRRENHK